MASLQMLVTSCFATATLVNLFFFPTRACKIQFAMLSCLKPLDIPEGRVQTFNELIQLSK